PCPSLLSLHDALPISRLGESSGPPHGVTHPTLTHKGAPPCHRRSCKALTLEGHRRSRKETMKTFEELFAELSEKARSRPEGSGTVTHLDAGVHASGKNVVEEAGAD